MNIKSVNMTIYEIEKSSRQFKQAHKVKVLGDVNEQTPKWFKDFIDNQFKPLLNDVKNIKTRLNVIEDKLERNNIK